MSQIRQVKEATNIIEVIGSKVSLQKSGSNWRGLCPFHSEKSPSFFVSEEMQRYRCFGCGKTGDVFTFLEEYEGMTFYEALEQLADAAGITLEKTGPSAEDQDRAQVLEALDLAKEYYHYLLTKHKTGAGAREYLKDRGVTSESIKVFQLGYALDQWDGLIKYLHNKKKYPLDILLQAGLVIRNKTGRYYDRFRSRVMFPLRNHRGQIVGFSGRMLPSKNQDPKAEKQAKYINSPETMVYHKSQLLFGYSELLQPIRKAEQVIVTEGEMDVIGSMQAHVNNVVAIKGSALTEQQVKLLSRTVNQIILCLDADSAGVEATKKAIEVINTTEVSRQTPLELRVIRIPAGKDPSELSKDNPGLWRDTAKKSITAYEFLIQVAFEQHDSSTPSGKNTIMAELVPVLSQIKHAVELEHYQKVLAEKLGVSISSVASDLQKFKQGKKFGKTAKKDEEEDKKEKKSETRREKLEKYVWFLLLHSNDDQLKKRAEQLQSLSLATPGATDIIETILETDAPSLHAVSSKLPDDLQQTIFQLYSQDLLLSDLEKIDISKEWQQALAQLKQLASHARRVEITTELEKLDELEDKTPEQQEKQEKLLRELVQLR